MNLTSHHLPSAPLLKSTKCRRSAVAGLPGFSLVEVTLAVAIASLAIITLLGLIPQGLEMSRKTGLLTNNSHILEQIIRDLENTQFSLLPAAAGGGASQRRFFNDQGQEVSSNSEDIVFVAEVDFSQLASLPQTEQMQPYLRRVIIRVANSADPAFTFGNNNRLAYTVFSHLIAKTH